MYTYRKKKKKIEKKIILAIDAVCIRENVKANVQLLLTKSIFYSFEEKKTQR